MTQLRHLTFEKRCSVTPGAIAGVGRLGKTAMITCDHYGKKSLSAALLP